MRSAALKIPNAVFHSDTSTSYATAVGISRASLLARLGQNDEARAAFDELVASDPSPLTYAHRASFKSSRDDPEEAVRADIEKAIALNPDFWMSYQLRGHQDMRAGKWSAVVENYRRAVMLNPADGSLRWSYAMALRKVGRLSDAQHEVTVATNDKDVRLRKAKLLIEHGYLQSAASAADNDNSFKDALVACLLDEGCG